MTHRPKRQTPDDDVAACCGLTRLQSQQDGYDLVKVGEVFVCGECLVEAGVIDEEPED